MKRKVIWFTVISVWKGISVFALIISQYAFTCNLSFEGQKSNQIIYEEDKVSIPIVIRNNGEPCYYKLEVKNAMSRRSSFQSDFFSNYSLSLEKTTEAGKEYNENLEGRGFLKEKKQYDRYNLMVQKVNGRLVDYRFGVGEKYEDFEVLLYNEDGHKKELLKKHHLKITKKIKRKMNLSVVKRGRPFNRYDVYEKLDFGNLRERTVKKVDLVVKSNVAFHVYMTSAYGGVLKNKKNKATIDYSLIINGHKKVNLKRPWWHPVKVARGRATGKGEFRLKANLSNKVKQKMVAGVYKDRIYVIVAPIE